MGQEANNYMSQIYSSFPKFILKTSIDFITLSIRNRTVKEIVDTLLKGNGFRVTSDTRVEKGLYRRKKSYKADYTDVKVDIFYQLKMPINPYKLSVTIHDPILEFVNFFDLILRYYSIPFKTSQVELTFDCFTKDREALCDFFQSHLFLRYQKSMSFQIKSTYYPNNPRRSTKRGRLYPKFFNSGAKSVRLELLLKRPLLLKQGLEFPLSKLSSLDLSRFFDFRYIDTEALRDHVIRENRHQIRAGNERRPGYGDLVIRVIDSWLSNIEAEESLMAKVERLKSKTKGIDNYPRFLHPLTEFNEAFMGAVRMQDFLY